MKVQVGDSWVCRVDLALVELVRLIDPRRRMKVEFEVLKRGRNKDDA